MEGNVVGILALFIPKLVGLSISGGAGGMPIAKRGRYCSIDATGYRGRGSSNGSRNGYIDVVEKSGLLSDGEPGGSR